jgi:hypothetical protein
MDFSNDTNTEILVSDVLANQRDLLVNSNDDLPTYVSVAASTAEKFRLPAAALDNIVLPKVTSVNTLKSEIVTLGGSVGFDTSCYSSDPADVTAIYGDLVVGITTAFAYTLGIGGFGFFDVVAYGTVYYDRLRAWNYPKLETQDASGENPFAGESWVTINSGNVGTGRSTNYAINDNGVAGIVFGFLTTGPCSGNAPTLSSITSKRGQITTIRSGITSDANSATVVKKYRMDYKLRQWGYNRTVATNNEEAIALNGVLGIITNPTYGGPY